MKQPISTARLAQICGVSQGTVDRALHGRAGIRAETREMILETARQYGYRITPAPEMRLIGVVVFDLYNAYFSNLLMEIERYCHACHASMTVMFSQRDKELEIDCIKRLYEMGVDGILLCPINHGEDFERFLSSLGLPVATVGNRLAGVPGFDIDVNAAVRELFRLLTEREYTSVAMVVPEATNDAALNASAPRDRLAAFREIGEASSLSLSVCYGVEQALALPPCDGKRAFFCSSDVHAIRLMNDPALRGCGFFGFDDLPAFSQYGQKLDTVSPDYRTLAERAVGLLLGDAPLCRTIPYRIILRGSL